MLLTNWYVEVSHWRIDDEICVVVE